MARNYFQNIDFACDVKILLTFRFGPVKKLKKYENMRKLLFKLFFLGIGLVTLECHSSSVNWNLIISDAPESSLV